MIKGMVEESQTASEVSQKLRDMAYRLNVTMIVIHHTRKQNGQAISIDSLAGSRVLAQEADFLIGVSKTFAGHRYIKEVAFRYKQENDETVIPFEINENCWIVGKTQVSEASLLYDNPYDRRRDDENVDLLYDILEERSRNSEGNVQTGPIAEDLDSRKVMSKPTFYSALKKLQELGKITLIRRGQYQVILETAETGLTTLTDLTENTESQTS